MYLSLKYYRFFLIIIIISILVNPILSIYGPDIEVSDDNNKSPCHNDLPLGLMKHSDAQFLYADDNNNITNATVINDATFFNNTITDNLSGLSSSGDDFVDIYKIHLDNHAYEAGLNADRFSIWLNSTAPFNLSLLLADPELHVLATTETGTGFPDGMIKLSSHSTGFHYLMVWLDPFEGYAEYNLTYNLLPETNILLDYNNDFSNGTAIDLIETDMGRWTKKTYSQAFSLNQSYDIHDFFNITINSTDNITIQLEPPMGSTYGIQLFNDSNITQKIVDEQITGDASNDQQPIYFDFNASNNYSLRIYSVYEDPTRFGGSGVYTLSVLIKPQNEQPTVRVDANDTIYLFEDNEPILVNLNDTIFFDPDIGRSNDNLSFFIIATNNETTNELQTDKLKVSIYQDNQTMVEPLPNINSTGENITFMAVDWLGWNISHNLTFIILPVNDKPEILKVNDFDISSHYLNLTNNESGLYGAFEDQQFNITIEAYDIDNNPLEFKYSSSITFTSSIGFDDPYKHNFSFIPTQDQVGIVQINISINESNNQTINGDWVLINITVNNTNDPPEIEFVNSRPVTPGDIIEFLGVSGVFAGNSLNFSVNATDHDLIHGDKLTFNTTNLTFIQREILKITKTSENSTNISFSPTTLDFGIKYINITVKDTEGTESYIILKIEVRKAEKKYSLTDEDCLKEYNDERLNDDYTFYELVYQRANSPISYQMMAYTEKGDRPGVDILTLASVKAGDYLNVTVKFKEMVEKNTTVRVFIVSPFQHYEKPYDIYTKILPEPYTPEVDQYILHLSYNDPMISDTGNPVMKTPNIVEFSIHLGTLENTYGIKHNVEFGLFAQAFKKGTNDYNYFTYDSAGVGSLQAPDDRVSYLLTEEECRQEETDSEDDVYGYQIKFDDQDRTAGLTLELAERTTRFPETDIIRLNSRRIGFYLEVIMTLADKVSNDTLVSYSLYIVTFNHTETGVHLTPNEVSGSNYPRLYAPSKEFYYQLAKYNAGTIIMADRVVVDENRLSFRFHLGLLQHPELGNLSHNSNFGIFATAIREMNSTSILDYGFYYDSCGFGSKTAPTQRVVAQEVEEDSEVPFWLLLGHFMGIPFIIIIIVVIIIISIIGGYASIVKRKYGSEVVVDVPPVPPIPSARGAHAPEYGVWPGRVRDEGYYNDLYRDDYGEPYGPEAAAGAAGFAGTQAAERQQAEYTYDVIPEDEEPFPPEQEQGTEDYEGYETDIGEEIEPMPTQVLIPEEREEAMNIIEEEPERIVEDAEPIQEEPEPVDEELGEYGKVEDDVLKDLHLPEDVEEDFEDELYEDYDCEEEFEEEAEDEEEAEEEEEAEDEEGAEDEEEAEEEEDEEDEWLSEYEDGEELEDIDLKLDSNGEDIDIEADMDDEPVNDDEIEEEFEMEENEAEEPIDEIELDEEEPTSEDDIEEDLEDIEPIAEDEDEMFEPEDKEYDDDEDYYRDEIEEDGEEEEE